ncbi:RNA-directed DNA polymerase [Bradyrhizobium sp. CIR18]|nr:RNA-directed DNA polymerase [Bradyrhizobium sp. CIR18]
MDEQSIEVFEADLQSNLYKLWNRMSSGSYFPPPVKRVQIDKRAGGKRPLEIPAVSDRVAQAVAKGYLEPDLEKHFHPDSFGYRPGKSALDAVGVARRRCWRHPFVLDLDIRAYFDSISHELLLKAIRKHTDCAWALLYMERWLKAAVQLEDGTPEPLEKGTPQGSVVSPLMANLFLHYAFDMWMRRNHPSIPFERYADDILCHCDSERQAPELKEALAKRFAECGLELHPDRRRSSIVRMTTGELNRNSTFWATRSAPVGRRTIGRSTSSTSAPVSAMPRRKQSDRKSVPGNYCRVDKRIDDLARMFNPIIRSWMNYYGRYYKSALYPTLRHPDRCLARWAVSKYKRLRRHRRPAEHWVGDIACRTPTLLANWPMLHKTAAGR